MGINLLTSSVIVIACLISKCDHELRSLRMHDIVIMILPLFFCFFTVSVRAWNVVCCPDIDCSNEIGVMSPQKCCLDTPNGLAYRIPAQEEHVVCIGEYVHEADHYIIYCNDPNLLFLLRQIVFGFFQDSFTGVEQGSGHMVQAGYQKGAAQAGQNLVFDVVDTPGTASEFTLLSSLTEHNITTDCRSRIQF